MSGKSLGIRWEEKQENKKKLFTKLKNEKWDDEKIKLFFGKFFENVENWKKGEKTVAPEKGTVLHLRDKITSAYNALRALEKAEKKDATKEEKDEAQDYKEGGVRASWKADLIEAYKSDAGKYFKYLLYNGDEEHRKMNEKIKEIVGYK